ncbi:serine protease inhibitor 42Dd-like isoform X3 [Anopheles merus]|nr:serine protease inhibitor 42Dd-like isoform X3 [Anopheles merus]XP_041773795.1 serine protease inhibitor 42Dd-like isoform X3 [Anopheles merus]XP_041773796.1 serine protease inhibitor 42Dd-like isoform X3 [Anopheles merus]
MPAIRRFGTLRPVLAVLLLLSKVQSIDHHFSTQPEITNHLDNLKLNMAENSSSLDAQFVSQSNSFATKLYQRISAKHAGENVVISPFSISACLSLAAMGAGGLTAEQMYSVLEFGAPDRKQTVADNYRRLMERLATDSTVNVANKIYVMQNYAVKGAFNAIATGSFRSEAESVNFAESAAAAKKINGWVEEKTNNKIKDLISPDALDELSRMVLVNAVHFKGTWTYQFDPSLTRPFPFWLSETESRDVPMMNIKKHFAFNNFEELGFSALELTYGGSDMTMMLLLPNERMGLTALEEKLPTLNLAELAGKMHKQEVEVFLPKFKIEFTRDLNEDLQALGMERMFSDSAEFPDLLEQNEPLKVSKVVHKAFIEVNEEGTEAAAATGMIMMMRCMPMHPYFTVDHPFLYVLRHQQMVYFVGRVAKIDA